MLIRSCVQVGLAFLVERGFLMFDYIFPIANPEEWHGWVFWRAIIWFCLHCQWVGPILWFPLCQATYYLWWCEPAQVHDSFLVFTGSGYDKETYEGNAHRTSYNYELVFREKWPTPVRKNVEAYFFAYHIMNVEACFFAYHIMCIFSFLFQWWVPTYF